MTQLNSKRDGFIVASLVISMTFVLLIAIVIFQLVANNFRIAQEESYRVNAQLVADAGIDSSIAELNQDESWTGTSGESELFNDGKIRTTYEVTVVNGASPSEKTINVTGRSYSPVSDTTPRSERSYSVDVRGLGVGGGGTFAIVTGVGGLIMQNSAKIVDGDVYVNGSISMSNSAQIGTTANSVSVKAAHNNCPTSGGSSFPTACTSSAGEPISTSNSATIYGQVCANNQTSSGGIDTSGSNGLYQVGVDTVECGSDNPIPALPLPDHDRAGQKAGTTSTTSNSYYTNCNSNSATRTWPHGTKIVGNVSISKKCKVIVEGDIWITGSLSLSNSAQLIVANSLNSGIVDGTYPTIMVDGANGISFGNSSEVVDNSSDTGVQFITYWSEAACSPDCANVTGNDLFDSSTEATIYLQQSSQAPGSILYAKWSQVDLNNGGDIGALVGQTVKLRNSAAVTFGASISGGSGGGSSSPTWLIKNYRRVFN